MTLTIGADPEVFVREKSGFISAHVFKCGTKERPLKTKHGAVQVDGVALEFNVRPAETSDKFLKNIRDLLEDLNVIVKRKHKKAKIEAVPTANFGLNYLRNLPLEVQMLGCNPDFDAYTGNPNDPPDGYDIPFRTGAGHVHFGWGRFDPFDSGHFRDCRMLAMELDYFLGLPSLSWDADQQRRQLYGKAGTFRPKPYGMEYRALSNSWLNSDDNIKLVFEQSVKGFNAWEEGKTTGNLLSREYGNYAKAAMENGVKSWGKDNPEIAEIIFG